MILLDWWATHEEFLGRNRSTTMFGTKYPTKGDWSLLGKELSKIHTPMFKLLPLLDM